MMTIQTCLDVGAPPASLNKILVSPVVEMNPYVVTLLATECRNLRKQKAHSAKDSIFCVSLCLRFRVIAAAPGQTSIWPGSPTTRIAATQYRGKDHGSSSRAKGAPPICAPSKIRALDHLTRYSHSRAIQRAKVRGETCKWLESLEGHAWSDACEAIAEGMKARALEAQGCAQ